MQLREERLAELVDAKDVGLRCGDRITYYSSYHDAFFAYAFGGADGSLLEVSARAHDVDRIRGYRQQLAAATDPRISLAGAVTPEQSR